MGYYITLTCVCIANFSTAFSTTYIFSYVGFLVRDFSDITSVNQAGLLAGYISGAMYFGRTFTASFWGFLSDKYGRRPILILSSISAVVFPLLFGFSTDVKSLIVYRILLGFFNGTIPVSRAMMTEVVPEDKVPFAFSVVSTMWSAGRILGPAISGWTTFVSPEDEDNSYSVSKNMTLTSEPPTYKTYFLPSLLASIFGLIGLILIFFFLPETLNKKSNERDFKDVEAEAFLSKSDAEEKQKDIEEISIRDFIWTRKFMCVTFIYSAYSFTVTFVNDILPLWVISSKSKGGLNLGTVKVGTIFAFGGLASLASAGGVYVMLSRMKPSLAFILTSICYALFVFSLPRYSVSISDFFNFAPLTGVVIINACREFTEVIVFNIVFLLINNSVHPAVKGSANGIILSVASILKMAGPVIGAPLYAWTIRDDNKFNFTFAFDLDTSLVLLSTFAAIFFLPKSTNTACPES